MRAKKYITIIACLLFLSIVIAQSNPARIYHGIIIEPSINILEADPGQTINGKVKLTNDFQNSGTVKYYPYIVNFRQKGETGMAELYKPENTDFNKNAASWVSFAEQDYSIKFGETVESNYSIKVPKDAVNGGYYIVLVYSQNNNQPQTGNITVGQEIGSLMFITIKGDNIEDTEFVDFYPGQVLFEMPPLDMFIRIKNAGNVHSTIGGNIFIHQGDISKPKATLEINPDNLLTLPGSTRVYSNRESKGFISFENNSFKINWGDTFYFGEYTATMKLRHMVNNQKVTTEKEIKFWVIPWKLILIVAIMIGGCIFAYFKLKSHKSA
jgi:hypothetical protein